MSIIYPFLCVILPCLIYQIIAIKQGDLKEKIYLVPHLIWVYIFLIYIYLALSVAGIGSIWDIDQYSEIIRLEEINLILFNSDGILTYILNIIMFMPLGFLLPLIWERFRNHIRVFLTGVGFSLAIEICQLFNHRATDIDDLMMNSLGAVLGYFIWVFVSKLFNSINKEIAFISKNEDTMDTYTTISISKNEAIMYLILSVLGEFFLYNWYLFLN
ncbi:VanZ family protein [Romboutsia sp. 1001713B170131_170501_G6]|uniref:VanZ family protein n=1 Tax=Romboutsia sp. 1001713B170131_170501_G6 TaxID=2787108 RepID=UPI001A9BCAF6|nr:VanZ family protein [Romboutsia sp. 1001713B170131_170501_G6]